MKSNTKNAKGSGTIRKRSDGRWEARYTTGIDPKTGKQTQKSVYGKTQKEVRQKLTEVTAEIDSGTYLEQTKDTVGEWLDTWLKTYALYSVKSYTYDAYERSCNIHIKPALGRIRLSALTAPQIQQFYNSLITEKELSPKTVKNIHGVLHRALGQAVKLGMPVPIRRMFVICQRHTEKRSSQWSRRRLQSFCKQSKGRSMGWCIKSPCSPDCGRGKCWD